MKKPDFKKLINEIWCDNSHPSSRFIVSKKLANKIWTDYVEPLQKRLEEAEFKLTIMTASAESLFKKNCELEKDRDEFAIGLLDYYVEFDGRLHDMDDDEILSEYKSSLNQEKK